MSRPFRFGVVIALVVLTHVMALHWLSSALQENSLLRPMATPMFTRMLQPTEPPPVVASPAPAPAPPPRRPTLASVAKKPAPKPAKKASAPASAPDSTSPPPVETASSDAAEPGAETAPVPQAAASAPAAAQSAASEPLAAASAPTPASAAASLDSWPADTRLNYRLSGWFRGNLYGSASVQWQRENDRYQNRVEIRIPPFAWLILTSQGVVTEQGLSPRIYEEQRRSGARGVQLNDEEVTLNDGRRVPRPPEVQDTASQFVELTHRFATGREKLEVGHQIELWLARPNGVDRWAYDIIERQVLELGGFGGVEAFHLRPRPIDNPRGNYTAEIWVAPALQYLPVRIRINMGEETYVELMAEKIEQR